MNTQIAIETAATGIASFPLEQLYLSNLNPRQDTDAEGIDLLADSIASFIASLQSECGTAVTFCMRFRRPVKRADNAAVRGDVRRLLRDIV